MEFLRFIFSSFWVWLGATTTVWGVAAIVIGGIAELVKAYKPETRRVETYRDGDRIKVTLFGASEGEARATHEAVVTATYNGYGYKMSGEYAGEEGEVCTNRE